jgi:tetrahydromethanopterin S-methyltransferase subunit C
VKRFEKKLWLGIFALAVLSPLGIILPEKFGAEGAWGEWGADALEKLLGYVPGGLKKTADIWDAPIRNYSFGGEGAVLSTRIVSYIVSAFIGIVLAYIIVLVISRLLFKHEK